MLKFGQAVLNYTLHSKETSDIMETQQDVAYDGNPYAMGWCLYSKTPVLVHSGTQQGCTTQLMIMKENNMVSVIVTNTSGAW